MLDSHPLCFFFFFNDTATTEIYTLSLHDALPILPGPGQAQGQLSKRRGASFFNDRGFVAAERHGPRAPVRSEEHTSELQSRLHLVCRLLLEKKKKNTITPIAGRNDG